MQFFLFDLQLQHDGVQLHVEIVGSLQFPLVVLPDVQRMSERRGKQQSAHPYVFVSGGFDGFLFIPTSVLRLANLSSSLRRLISSSSSL